MVALSSHLVEMPSQVATIESQLVSSALIDSYRVPRGS